MKEVFCTITSGCASGILYVGLNVPAEQPYCFSLVLFASLITICIAIID
jgi:xanthosine utilization system XapX-like protein